MMGAFLDSLGIAHEDGLINEDNVTVPDAEKVKAAADGARRKVPRRRSVALLQHAGLAGSGDLVGTDRPAADPAAAEHRQLNDRHRRAASILPRQRRGCRCRSRRSCSPPSRCWCARRQTGPGRQDDASQSRQLRIEIGREDRVAAARPADRPPSWYARSPATVSASPSSGAARRCRRDLRASRISRHSSDARPPASSIRIPSLPRWCSLASQTAPIGSGVPKARCLRPVRQNGRSNCSSTRVARTVTQAADRGPLLRRQCRRRIQTSSTSSPDSARRRSRP